MIRILSSLIAFQIFLLSIFLSAASGQERVEIIVSIYPLKDIVEQVGGEKVRVDFIIPPGASPHTFEPKPSDMKKLNRAEAIFLIGGGLEFWSEKVIKSLSKRPRVEILSKGLPLLREDHGHENKEKEIFDPHIWLDPVMVMMMVDRIRDTLIDLDRSNKTYYIQNTTSFKRELERLHSRITESVKGFRTREFVTFHSAWNYFSRRYGLKVIEIIEESPGKEASPAHIARIIEAIRRTKSTVIFAEPQFNPKAAETIARETGARLFFLDPIGGPHIKGRNSYIGLMNYNLSVLEKALR
ncbi:MAG: metal ABC transporter substrate-binding protein [Thermodesulfovibrionales bacterium]